LGVYELILYHDGIQASASVKYGVTLKPKEDSDGEWDKEEEN
jgi:hypothetical protein